MDSARRCASCSSAMASMWWAAAVPKPGPSLRTRSASGRRSSRKRACRYREWKIHGRVADQQRRRQKMTPVREVYAIKYAEHDRNASANFIGGDAHDGPMPMDCFVWLIRGPCGVWAIDTGFNQEAATARGRRLLRNPATALGLIGESAADIRNVIV